MVKQVPNIITSLNVLCGSVAVLFAVSGDLINAAIFVFLGIFFDFFDGLAARLLNAHSEVGLQMDSLADVITSGLAPGIVMYQMLNLAYFGHMKSLTETFSGEGWNVGVANYIPLLGLIIVIAAAYRLAKFNVDTRQTTGFIGLPTPANTILVLSLPLILEFQYTDFAVSIILNKWVLIGITLLGSVLMNAEIPLFALKFKSWDFKTNAIRYIFLILCVVLLVLLKFVAIPFIILLYIVLSLFSQKREAV
ncbi:CDP-alcohol phosphatidyltransferase family protein [Aequorivita marina]|uniref:CDP-alcohol phosphatidyltransferase family protein n=1 Tax=Aequorivita marina TaxID=3073654 RepID=UPI002874AE82|nr:CDP-alcohol phosphatidyltransferase family protein [Aequorivita sp. S2608]MDS1299250.1 CDP-alcohol phosphatidyltransferase family protein [Aequorivita sp. S2608]